MTDTGGGTGGLDRAVEMVTQAERDLFQVLLDEGVERGEAFCCARSIYRRVLHPRMLGLAVSIHERQISARQPVSA